MSRRRTPRHHPPPTAVVCAVCARPTPDHARLCPTCDTRLRTALAGIPALVDDLHTALTRQAKVSLPPAPRQAGDGPGLPQHRSIVNWHASGALADLRTALIAAAMPWAAGHPPDTPHAAAAVLLDAADRIRLHEDAALVHDQVTTAAHRAQRSIDTRPQLYAGPCDCGRDLYADADASLVACTACGLRHEVAERRDWLLQACDEHLATAAEIGPVLAWLIDGEPGTPRLAQRWAARISDWRYQGRLTQRPGGRYRVGDVLPLAAQVKPRATRNA